MKFAYISPSTLPSRSANSVHVIMQCSALMRCTDEIVLYAKRTVAKKDSLADALASAYGESLTSVRLVTFWSRLDYGNNLRIAMIAIYDLLRNEWPDIILSRNLYASLIIAVFFRKPILFETHQLELGFRKTMQRLIMNKPWVVTVVISDMLKQCLTEHHGKGPFRTVILHDAAPEKIESIAIDKRRISMENLVPETKGKWRAICGYFGHLYSGRGVEIIEQMAKLQPDVLFLLFGGNESDVDYRRRLNIDLNVIYVGHVPHQVAQQAMKSVDILLMPYQTSVSIGSRGHDTAKWMSPMKMFEYMATGVPIISSDLPVLREVLEDKKNALLVPANDAQEWANALEKLLNDVNFARDLGNCALADYNNKHTWTIRAKLLIAAGSS